MGITGSVTRLRERYAGVRDHYVLVSLVTFLKTLASDRVTSVGLLMLIFVSSIAVVGPEITPYAYDAYQFTGDGALARLQQPSGQFWLGTTIDGYDVLSRVLYGARSTLMFGFLGGTLTVTLGLTVGLTAGYVGGTVEEALMRITDVFYGIPFIPTAIIVVAFFGVNTMGTILLIAVLGWVGSARIFRSQVLQIKERQYVKSAENLGASRVHVILKHIIPNMGELIVLFYALSIGLTILLMASLSFLGMTNPFIPSWGVMLRNAYNAGYVLEAWWWSLPPGFMISMTVLSLYLIGRGYSRLQERRETGEVI